MTNLLLMMGLLFGVVLLAKYLESLARKLEKENKKKNSNCLRCNDEYGDCHRCKNEEKK